MSKEIYHKYKTMYQAFNLNGKVSPAEFYGEKVIIATDNEQDYISKIANYSQRYSEYDRVFLDSNLVRNYIAFRQLPEDTCVHAPFDFYHQLHRGFTTYTTTNTDIKLSLNNYAMYLTEQEYYRNGRPYYKIPNHILHAMLHTTSDIKIKEIKMPFNTFTILLPEGNITGVDYIMVSCALIESKEIKDELQTTINFKQTFEGAENKYYQIRFFISDVAKGEALLSHICISSEDCEKTIGEMYEKDKESIGYNIDLLRLFLSVCLLGTGSQKNELIEPDIMEPLLAEYRHNKTPPTRKNKIIRLSKEKGYTGFIIGALDSEKKLPNGVKINDTELIQDTATYIKRRPHIRTGHIRRQAIGKNWSEHKKIFIFPTVIGYGKEQNNKDDKDNLICIK